MVGGGGGAAVGRHSECMRGRGRRHRRADPGSGSHDRRSRRDTDDRGHDYAHHRGHGHTHHRGHGQIGADDSEGFDTDRLRMTAGETVTVVFDNRDAGGEPHNWHVVVGEDEYATTIAQGPDTQEVTFTVGAAGEYTFFCDTHLGQMEGTLIVEP